MLAGREHSRIFAKRFFFTISRNMGESPVDHDNIAARIQQHDRFTALRKYLCSQLKLFFLFEMLQGEIDIFHQFEQQTL